MPLFHNHPPPHPLHSWFASNPWRSKKTMAWRPYWMTKQNVLSSNMAATPLSFGSPGICCKPRMAWRHKNSHCRFAFFIRTEFNSICATVSTGTNIDIECREMRNMFEGWRFSLKIASWRERSRNNWFFHTNGKHSIFARINENRG